MKLSIVNPATGSTIKEVEQDSASSIEAKFKRAAAAQKKWAATPFATRLACIKKFHELVSAEKEELAQTLTAEVGKPISQAMNEINGLLPRLEFFIKSAEDSLKDEVVFDDGSMKEIIRHEPLGVIANISAWNYPYFVGSNVFVPALLTGNAVLYKPSEFATLTGFHIDRLLHKAGIPEDAFITVVGGAEAGKALLNQKIAGVFFTGSYATGKKIAEAAASRMIKVQLELGGKDPVYVCEDVDAKAVAEGTADGAMYNTGQSCCSVERIYVHEKVYDQFLSEFVRTVQSFEGGKVTDPKTYVGALTRGKVHMDFLTAQVKDAVAKGAKVVCGGNGMVISGGYYFEPTVLTGVNHTMDVMREETFGPVIGIQKVKSDEEALALMNDTDYGLTAAVYTKNPARGEKLLGELNAGSAYMNCCDRVSPRLPWTGRKHSGMGSTLSHYGIKTFTQPKGYHLRKS